MLRATGPPPVPCSEKKNTTKHKNIVAKKRKHFLIKKEGGEVERERRDGLCCGAEMSAGKLHINHRERGGGKELLQLYQGKAFAVENWCGWPASGPALCSLAPTPPLCTLHPLLAPKFRSLMGHWLCAPQDLLEVGNEVVVNKS